MTGRKISESETTLTEIVFPNDVNPLEYLRGGKLIDWMDIACEIVVQKHSNHVGLTVSVKDISFDKPIHIGDVVTIKARLVKAFNTSMEIEVEVWAENVSRFGEDSHLQKIKTNEARFIFVAVDTEGKPVKIPGIIPETASIAAP